MGLVNKETVDDLMDVSIAGGEAAAGVLIPTNPIAAAAVAIFSELSRNRHDIKLKYIVNGLGKGLDEEKYKNELVNYIGSSEKRAKLVTDTFKKSTLQLSRISITLMGLILTEKMKQNTDPSHEDFIIYNALENANDFDLSILRKILCSGKVKVITI